MGAGAEEGGPAEGQDPGEAVAVEAEGVSLPQPRPRGRDIYQKTRSHYAELYQSSVRGINKWIEKGLSADPPEAPPLDDPEKMEGWWIKHMVHRVPARLLDAARRAAEARRGAEPEAVSSPALPVGGADLFAPREEVVKASDTGFFAALMRARSDERRLHELLEVAIREGGDEGKVRALTKDWQASTNHLRQLEKDAPDVLAKSGDMFLAVDVQAELAPIHLGIRNGVEAMWRRFSVKIGVVSDVTMDRLWAEECGMLWQGLMDSRFGHE